MITLHFCLIFFFFIQFNTILTENEVKIMNIYYIDGKYECRYEDKVNEESLAGAIYQKKYEQIGWDYLAISSTSLNYDDSQKAYAMGYIEGVITKDRIYDFFKIVQYSYEIESTNEVKEFLDRNLKYMKQTSEQNMAHEPYWEHIYYAYQQLIGLYEGYNSVAEEGKIFDKYLFILLTLNVEYEDIKNYKNKKNRPKFKEMTIKEINSYVFNHSHCSAIIKLHENFDDIWVAHNTWDKYSSLLRLIKEYKFITKNGHEKSKVSVFSSSPGVLASYDDFYY